MSIAGKRAGLDGARSGLFYQAIRIIKEMREATDGKYPRYAVWENVEGSYSSNNGEDFRAVLGAVIGVKEEGVQVPAPEDHRWPKADVLLGDGWSVAYRTFDSQYWGVPQRRVRIYLVADFGGGSAPEILFKSEGMSGDPPEGICPWQGPARGTEEGTGEAGGGYPAGAGYRDWCLNTQGQSGVTVTDGRTGTLIAQDHGNHPAVLQAADPLTEPGKGYGPAPIMLESHPTDSRLKISKDGVCQTLTKYMGTGGNNVPLLAEPFQEEDMATYCATTGSYMTVAKEVSPPLMARDWKDPQVVNAAQNPGDDNAPMYIVRRLTPKECARLQGFDGSWCSGLAIPDPTEKELAFWTEVWDTWQELNGKKPTSEKQVRKWLASPHTDAAEYKMWGNGLSVPVAYFVLSGIAWAARKEASAQA